MLFWYRDSEPNVHPTRMNPPLVEQDTNFLLFRFINHGWAVCHHQSRRGLVLCTTETRRLFYGPRLRPGLQMVFQHLVTVTFNYDHKTTISKPSCNKSWMLLHMETQLTPKPKLRPLGLIFKAGWKSVAWATTTKWRLHSPLIMPKKMNHVRQMEWNIQCTRKCLIPFRISWPKSLRGLWRKSDGSDTTPPWLLT